MPFDFKKLPWKNWINDAIKAGIWRMMMRMPWWLALIVVAMLIAVLAWLIGNDR